MLGAAKGQATVVVDAPPERVYELVSDVTRMGDWSPECKGECGSADPSTSRHANCARSVVNSAI
jgi:uncharacterized protein YndB with AHSA1/START domain